MIVVASSLEVDRRQHCGQCVGIVALHDCSTRSERLSSRRQVEELPVRWAGPAETSNERRVVLCCNNVELWSDEQRQQPREVLSSQSNELCAQCQHRTYSQPTGAFRTLNFHWLALIPKPHGRFRPKLDPNNASRWMITLPSDHGDPRLVRP